MNGWFGDFFRTAWALGYWNTRKTLFVLNRRRGQCPCQNPSDTGRALATGCEAIAEWRQPERFQKRVCPLLAKNQRGHWACGVEPAAVRPFWGRALSYASAAGLMLALVAGVAVFGAMRGIGYKVSLRQVVWPPAWSELRQVQVQLFIDQAQAHFQAGRANEAVSALNTAYEQNPDHYRIGMLLAQFYQVTNPDSATRIYTRLLRRYPEKRRETARVFFSSLLAQGHLEGVAAFCANELKTSKDDTVAWLHGLIFAVRQSGQPDWLSAVMKDPAVGAKERAVLTLEFAVRRASRAEAARLVRSEPLVDKFPYARVQRAELLTEFGRPKDALALLAASREELTGREVVRLALAAEAVAGDQLARRRDAKQLLASERQPGESEITVVAIHLIRYPDAELLEAVVNLWRVIAALPNPADQLEATIALLAAAGAGAHKESFNRVRDDAVTAKIISYATGNRLTDAFFPEEGKPRVERVLPSLPGLSLELNYALIEWSQRAAL
ncbi:tetratricopeptide repeat protein [Oleiharenicola lentus]|uniref:tetratricopeptide repeat protein n=1 Tax=Oleiharenicola lentus TaxID=2508720 RepID=UPI003F67AB13